MKKIATLRTTVLFASALFAAASANAAEKEMKIRGIAAPPVGYVQFCAEYPADCRGSKDANQVVSLTQAVWNQLNQVNTAVNTAVLPATAGDVLTTAATGGGAFLLPYIAIACAGRGAPRSRARASAFVRARVWGAPRQAVAASRQPTSARFR